MEDRYVPLLRNAYWKLSGGQKVYCVCFHDVSDSLSTFSVTPEEFHAIITAAKERIIGIDELGIKNIIDPIVLTFDDGFESLISTVAPYLYSEKIPFTSYITVDYINREGYLTEDQLKELSQNKYCTIGSHMCSHSKTRQMTIKQVEDEWVRSKKILQDLTGKEVCHAALPYGSYNSCSASSKRVALKVGYKSIANTIATPFGVHSREIFRYVYQKNNDRIKNIL